MADENDPKPEDEGDDGGTPKGDDAGTPKGEKTWTQAEVEETVRKRLAQQASSSDRELSKTRKRLAELEEAEKKRERETMTEVERARVEAEEARAELDAAQRERQRLEADARRFRVIARDAADLPAAYRELVQGDDDEAIATSVEKVREQYTADVRVVEAGVLREVVGMDGDALVKRYGDAAKPLAERLKIAPTSIGASGRGSGPPSGTPTDKPLGEMTEAEAVAYLESRGIRLRGRLPIDQGGGK